jgi:N-acetylglucosamine-6-phosphate deacetylase
VHVHGVDGVDALDEGDAVLGLAARLPRHGVTAFCPTTVACAPGALGRLLAQVRSARQTPPERSARVLPAHLESNFINPDYRGAQPAACLRSPRAALEGGRRDGASQDFDGSQILREIERARPDVGIVTLAPELEGGIDLVRRLVESGHRVSLGHSGATFEEALDAIAAGACQATHLFNRMPPLAHRAPGLVGAVLQDEAVAAELICDGFHVHPALVRTAIAAKQPSRIMAITDGTAGSGLSPGATALLGGQTIIAGESAAYLADGTLAGSILTMAKAFQKLLEMGVPIIDATVMCSTTPARELGLVGHGVLAAGAVADVVVLDARFAVVQTYVGGQLAFSRNTGVPLSV